MGKFFTLSDFTEIIPTPAQQVDHSSADDEVDYMMEQIINSMKNWDAEIDENILISLNDRIKNL